MNHYWLFGDLKVRPATAADYPEVSAFYDLVIEAVSGTEYDVLWTKECHPTEEHLQKTCASGELIVGVQDGRIVAAGIVDGDGGPGYDDIDWPTDVAAEKVAVLHLFCTHPEARRQRIGMRMLQGVACEARLRGKRVVRIDVLEHVRNAQRLYESVGFVHVTSCDYIYVDPLVEGRIAEMYEWNLGERERVLVSACLLGEACRYDGCSFPVDEVQRLADTLDLVPVCPEQMGGLETPRTPCELVVNPVSKIERVLTQEGVDRTDAFTAGAQAVVAVSQEYGCNRAVLKSKSPSCGVHQVYDGSFSGTLVAGSGLTARALVDVGVALGDETELASAELS